MSNKYKGYEKDYSEESFWEKVGKYAKMAGKEVIEVALKLYFAARKPETPAWAKTVIYGALGYFIVPLDAIPDMTPVAGYFDDLGVLTFAFATCAMYIDEDVNNKAKQKIKDWFGED
jgi:uncharacterized membrane protein YkvA (DUF1232 family)